MAGEGEDVVIPRLVEGQTVAVEGQSVANAAVPDPGITAPNPGSGDPNVPAGSAGNPNIVSGDIIQELQDRVKQLETQNARQNEAMVGVNGKQRSPKLGDPERYSGTNSGSLHIVDWLNLLGHWLVVSSLDVGMWVDTAVTYLSGDALRYYMAVCEGTSSVGRTWEWFRELMIGTFGSDDREAAALRAITGLRQGRRRVADYARQFQELNSRIRTLPLSQGDLINRFNEGLDDPHVRRAVLQKSDGSKYTQLTDLIRAAVDYDTAQLSMMGWRQYATPEMATTPVGDNSGGSVTITGPVVPSSNGQRRNRKRGRDERSTLGAAGPRGAAPGRGGAVGSPKGPRRPLHERLNITSELLKARIADNSCLCCGKPDHRWAQCPENNTVKTIRGRGRGRGQTN